MLLHGTDGSIRQVLADPTYLHSASMLTIMPFLTIIINKLLTPLINYCIVNLLKQFK
jgi:hypothetical protein